MKLFILSLFLCLSIVSNATTYYVDASTTSTTQNGALATPWKTLTQVTSNMNLFQPGDFVLFKRGQVFPGILYPTRGGTATAPLTFGAYGTGARPKFTGTGAKIGYLFYVYDKSYITFRDLSVTDPTIDNADRGVDAKILRAFTFDLDASFCKVISCDVQLVGTGGYFIGGNNTMDSTEVSNLRMMLDTDQGNQPGNDDDYGANPLVISSSNNTITHNYFHDCWANSYDYTYDGGAIEFYGSGTNNNMIAYNTIVDCLCVSEVTGTSTNNTFAYNKLINNGSLFYFQGGYSYTNWKFYNNVVIENIAPRLPESRLLGGSIGGFIMKNNIFHLSNGVDVASNTTGVTHEDNIYKLSNNSVIGFTAGTSELSTSLSLFTSTTATSPLSWNFAPVAGSPAIDFGQNVGLTKDFAGNAVPTVPNSGILESSAGSGGGAALTAASSATIINCNGASSVITVTATGGTAPYTGTGTFTVKAGTFTYTVTDAAGATATTTIIVSQPTALSAAVVAATAPSASGTAAVTVTVSGGTPSYTYNIDGGSYQSANVFAAVSVGAHTIIVKDGRGCTVSKPVTVSYTATAPLVITAVTGTISCNGGSASVTISATGGRTPYTGTGVFSVTAGSRTFTVTDANGTSGTYTVTVTQPAAISITLTSTAILVPGGVSVITTSATGGTAPYTYQLAAAAFVSSNVFTGIGAGTYAITVKDARGCTSVKSITISQPVATALAIKLVSKQNLTCQNKNDGKIVVTATGGAGGYLYKISNNNYRTSGTFSNLRPGTYTLKAKDAAGTISSMSVSISNSSIVCGTARSSAPQEQPDEEALPESATAGNEITTLSKAGTANTFWLMVWRSMPILIQQLTSGLW